MQVALIVPGNEFKDINSDNKNFFDLREIRARQKLWSCPNLSLLTVAGMMPGYFDIEYIDLNLDKLPDKRFDIVFFSPTTAQVTEAYKLAKALKKQGSLIVMGGIHVSFLPEEALKHIDVLFIGECEETFPVFLKDLSANSLKRVYKSSSYINLNKTPVPRYDLIRKYNYKTIPLQTSRGCPHQCNFCISSSFHGREYRRKTIEQVANEISLIKSIWNNPYIFFSDDNLFIDKTFTHNLLQLLKDNSIYWSAFSDIQIAEKPDLLKRLKESGCNRLIIGFESLSKNNLFKINSNQWKQRKRDKYKKAIEDIQSYGIGIVGSFVLGFDEDNINTFDELYDFIIDTNLFATNITVLTPFPGSGLYTHFNEENRIITTDWSKYNGFEMTFKTLAISKQDFNRKFIDLYMRLNSQTRINKILENFKNIYNRNLEETSKNKTILY